MPTTALDLPKTILIADDDADDRLFLSEAIQQHKGASDVKFVEDGEELMDYLTHRNGFSDLNAPAPSLILLDLNMPRKNGFQALAEIKSHPKLKRLPVVILSTSSQREDIDRTYAMGVNSYLIKPSSFDRLAEMIGCLKTYWLDVAQLPR